MMCKAAGLTSRIRMGAAVKLIHLHHPVDVAIQSAVTDHLTGGRYIFGFGSGFPLPLFCEERGLSFEDRHERLHEALDFILKCWATDKPFDWDGEHWKGKGVVALPKPFAGGRMPMATATDSEPMIRIAGERGYTLISAFLESAGRLKPKADLYAAAAEAAGIPDPRRNITASRIVYIADSEREAIEDLRPAVTHEIGFQAERGFLKMLEKFYDLRVPNDERGIEALVEAEFYLLGEPDSVAEKIKRFHDESGGFGTFLIVTGKDWATRAHRERSMRRFMEEVVPQLRDVVPVETVAA